MDNAGLHAFHAAELPYMWGNLDRTPPRWPRVPETATEAGLSSAMVDYWVSFARTGQPAAEGADAWAAYGSAGAYMTFAGTPRAGVGLMPGMYALHEQAMCRRRASGDLAWNWNTGLMSPKLPGPAPGCR